MASSLGVQLTLECLGRRERHLDDDERRILVNSASPQTGLLSKVRNEFLIILQAEKWMSNSVTGEDCFLVHEQLSSHCVFLWREG